MIHRCIASLINKQGYVWTGQGHDQQHTYLALY